MPCRPRRESHDCFDGGGVGPVRVDRGARGDNPSCDEERRPFRRVVRRSLAAAASASSSRWMVAARWVGSIVAGYSCCTRMRSACAISVPTRSVVRFVKRRRWCRLVRRRALLACRDDRWWLWRRLRWPGWLQRGVAMRRRRCQRTVRGGRRQRFRCPNRHHQGRRARPRSLMNVFAGRVLPASRRRMARRCALRMAAPGPTKTRCSCNSARVM